MKKLIILFVLFNFTINSCKGQLSNPVKVISYEEVQNLLQNKDVQLIDVRTPEEYETGFIDNAQNINYFSPTFVDEIQQLDKQKPVILYCRSGNRSSKSAEKFTKAGFVTIYDLEGGITKWKEEGLEIYIK